MDNYYINEHLKEIIEIFDDLIIDKTFKNFVKKMYFAGGCIRSLLEGNTVNDYDLFIYDKDTYYYIQNISMWSSIFDKEVLIFRTQNAVSITFPSGEKFQIILKIWGSPDKVIESFDFTNCMGYYIPSMDILYISSEMKFSVENKNLVFNPLCLSKGASIKRLWKFIKLGYKMSDLNFFYFCKEISKLSLKDLEEDFYYTNESDKLFIRINLDNYWYYPQLIYTEQMTEKTVLDFVHDDIFRFSDRFLSNIKVKLDYSIYDESSNTIDLFVKEF